MDEISDLIREISEEINGLVNRAEPRQPGDIDIQQLVRAKGWTESSTRRNMKKLGKHREQTGFDCLMVYDQDVKHNLLVLRRYVPPA